MGEDDRTSSPFLVQGPDGNTDWYCDGAIMVVSDNDDNKMTPLGESLEGAALFSRFPVREGTWYAEVEVAKLGKSQPCVGWGVVKKNPKKAERTLLIGGKLHCKLDIGEGAPVKEKKEEKKEAEKSKEGEEKKEAVKGDL